MKSNLLLFIFAINSILFFSCSNKTNEDFIAIQTTNPYDFHSIVLHNHTLYATGGDVWNKSNILTSMNGIDWSIDSLTNKSIFDLYSKEETLYGVGNDGYIFSGTEELKLTRTKHWGMLRSIASTNKNFLAVGGKDFNKGWIYNVNQDLQIDSTFQYEHELLAIECSQEGICVTCGYGIILTSNDYGSSWVRIDENGDYYNSISSNSNGQLYIVGYSGTLIVSSNQGKDWNKIKNGHSPIGTNKPFRSIKFQDDIGVIVGDNGLIWISENGGEEWTDISIDTNKDLFDFEFFESKIVCVSEQGSIFLVEI